MITGRGGDGRGKGWARDGGRIRPSSIGIGYVHDFNIEMGVVPVVHESLPCHHVGNGTAKCHSRVPICLSVCDVFYIKKQKQKHYIPPPPPLLSLFLNGK